MHERNHLRTDEEKSCSDSISTPAKRRRERCKWEFLIMCFHGLEKFTGIPPRKTAYIKKPC